MAKYYFDIETYPTPNPDTAKIITIQFQRINGETGKPEGELVILKEWECKPHNGEAIKKWYENKEYDKIDNYIVEETRSFLEFLQKIIELLREYELPEVRE